MPQVLIVLGSDSDLPLMAAACATLEAFQTPFSLRVLSAHRLPDEVGALARQARAAGYRVIIAAAGLAAALPGVLAGHTTLPVIGVPISAGALKGQDALYSIVQMPPGVPVATVGIDAAKNAALLALQIIAASDPVLAARLDADREDNQRVRLATDEKVQALGYAAYLAERKSKK